ncbi:MAG: GNAT family N-acetyltransferase [Gemmatimonadota bacterium]
MNDGLPVGYALRPITETDDAQVARVIRTVMPEFGADGPGFAIHDPEVNAMTMSYDRPRASYYVVTHLDRVVGGGGVAPLDGGSPDTCELRKMYFLPEARGLGLGRVMLHRCLQRARAIGYRYCYLETLERMRDARRLYEANGFVRIEGALGATGHTSCDTFYQLDLTAPQRELR